MYLVVLKDTSKDSAISRQAPHLGTETFTQSRVAQGKLH